MVHIHIYVYLIRFNLNAILSSRKRLSFLGEYNSVIRFARTGNFIEIEHRAQSTNTHLPHYLIHVIDCIYCMAFITQMAMTMMLMIMTVMVMVANSDL